MLDRSSLVPAIAAAWRLALHVFAVLGAALVFPADGSAAEVPIVFTVGDGTEGVFDDRNVGYRFSPRELSRDVRSIAAGRAFFVYITNSGQLWGCGQNDVGQLGDGSNLHRPRPVLIASDVAAAACGSDHLLFIKTDGTAWATGANAAGQLGDGTTQNRNMPVQVATDTKSVVAGGAHTLIVKNDDSLWGCGDGAKGQLGAVTAGSHTTWVQLAAAVATVAAEGDFSVWAGKDGSLWGTGDNTWGQLGDGTIESKFAPTQIMPSGVSRVGAGRMHSLVIKTDGTLWAAGSNLSGQLGDGTIGTTRRTHILITSGIVSADGGYLSSLLIGTDGVLRVVGYNYYGNLGIARSQGTPLRPLSTYSDVTMVAAGMEFSCFLTADGTAWVTGRNDLGQLGDGLHSFRASPQPVAGSKRAASARFSSGLYASPEGGLSWTPSGGTFAIDAADVATGGSYDLAITQSGQLWGIDRSAPGFVAEFAQFAAIPDGTGVVAATAGSSHIMFVRQDGSLWGMGSNRYGELGDGTTTTRTTPVKIADQVARVSAWAHSLFIKSDGSLWGAGYNTYGQLGTGNTTHVSTPVQIATDVAWASAGGEFTLFVKSDGTLWGIGRNNVGQLGLGTQLDALVPTLISTGVARAWGGANHSAILKTDGSLWTTGANLNGQLGDGTFTPRLSPVRIAEHVTWAEAGVAKTIFMRQVATPTIVVSPANPTVTPGGQVTLQASVTGEGTPSFQWYQGPSGDVSRPVEGATTASFSTPALSAGASFWVRVTTFAGTGDSATVPVSVAGPTITAQPSSQASTAGDDVALSVTATDAEGASLTYQWYFGDTPIDGATGASLTIRSVQVFHAGSYSVAVSAGGYTTRSTAAVVSVAVAPASGGRLLNLSTRALDLEGENQLIPGFVLSGAGTKRVLIRGVGPSLAPFGVSGALLDPRMEVKRGSATVAVNDDWGTNPNKDELLAVSQALGAFDLAAGSRDAALLLDLPAGVYTVPTPGVGGAIGVALVELYDADAGTPTVNLVNMSNRGFVGTGDNIMIPGVVISEHGRRTLLIRAVGPRLSGFGVAGVLEDPRLTIYRRVPGNPPVDEIIHTNDNWGDASNATTTAQVAAQVSAFPLDAGSKDAALVVTLKPGLYTVQANGVGTLTGVALVEVYLVP